MSETAEVFVFFVTFIVVYPIMFFGLIAIFGDGTK